MTEEPQNPINVEFNDLENNLKYDITHIEKRMSDIQQYIIVLDSHLNNLQLIIKSEKDTSKKSMLYKVYNNTLETIAKFQQIYQSFFQTKYNYRHEHDDLIYRKLRLIEVEMKRSTEGELTPTVLLTTLQQLSRKIDTDSKTPNTLMKSVEELENNDLYKI